MSNLHSRKKEACSPPCFAGDTCQSWAWGQQGVLPSSIPFQTLYSWEVSAPCSSQMFTQRCFGMTPDLQQLIKIPRRSLISELWNGSALFTCYAYEASAEQIVEVSLSLSLPKCEPNGGNHAYAEYFQGILFVAASLQCLSKLPRWHYITSNETSLKKPKEAHTRHLSPRVLCSGLSEWKKNLDTVIGEFRVPEKMVFASNTACYHGSIVLLSKSGFLHVFIPIFGPVVLTLVAGVDSGVQFASSSLI